MMRAPTEPARGSQQPQTMFSSFLRSLRAQLKGAKETPGVKVNVVVGNEAGDLDTVVSSISLAYLLNETDKTADTVALPLLPFARDDLVLRPECIKLLCNTDLGGPLGFSTDDLLFWEDLSNLIPTWLKEKRCEFTLVDHNFPSFALQGVGCDHSVIRAVFDHHAIVDENALARIPLTSVKLVGSTCTLILQEFQRLNRSLLNDCMLAYFLWSTIVLDTVNFSPERRRFLQDDMDAVATLEELLGKAPGDRCPVYISLENARYDTTGLNVRQLLRKDCKLYSVPKDDSRYAISTCLLEWDDFQRRASGNFDEILREFAKGQNLVFVGIILAHFTVANEHRKELVLFDPATPKRKTFDSLVSSPHIAPFQLELLEQFDTAAGSLYHFSVHEASFSRKTFQPAFSTFLGEDCTS